MTGYDTYWKNNQFFGLGHRLGIDPTPQQESPVIEVSGC